MKKPILFSVLSLLIFFSWGQDTNTFPPSGSVGIGTTDPTGILHVYSTGGTNLRIETNDDNAARLYLMGSNQMWSMRKLTSNHFAIADDTDNTAYPFRIEPGAGSNALRISSEGFVGIGQAEPTSKLHIYKTGSVNLNLETDGDNAARLYLTGANQRWSLKKNDSNHFVITDDTNGKTPFKINAGAEGGTLTIDSEGQVGVGISDPTSKLHIYSTDGANMRIETNDDYAARLYLMGSNQMWSMRKLTSNDFVIADDTDNTAYPFRIETGAGSNALRISSEGFVGIGHTEPTSKLHLYNSGSVSLNLETDDDNAARLYLTGANQQWSVRKLNTNDFVVTDDTNNGTHPFRIEPGATGNTLRIDSEGQVGVGTADPSSKLHIYNSGGANLRIETDDDNAARLYLIGGNQMWSMRKLTNNDFVVTDDTNNTAYPFRIEPGAGSNALRINSEGNIGIGTSEIDSKLTVAGKIHSREIKVSIVAGADFVFDEEYQLTPLEGVKEFISEHKHFQSFPLKRK